MKPPTRMNLFAKVLLLSLTLLIVCVLDQRSVVSAQFIEDFGHIGTLKMVKGQVRDSISSPVSHATLRIINVVNETNYVISANEDGNFIKPDLPSGKYRIRVEASGFNIGEFTVTLSRGRLSAARKFMIIKLSPGCASGDPGVSLVTSIKKR